MQIKLFTVSCTEQNKTNTYQMKSPAASQLTIFVPSVRRRGASRAVISLSLSPSLRCDMRGGKEEEEQEAERDGMDQCEGRAFFGLGCRFRFGDV